MNLRLITGAILLFFCQSLFAATCEQVFPSGSNLIGSNAQPLINIPNNTSTDALSDGLTIPRGDNYYLYGNLANQDDIFVGPGAGTARIYIRGSASWQNAKINETGNPEDVFIYVAGSLSITGGNTDINAIIYVEGGVSQNGNGASITGALTAGSGSANVTYDANAVANVDLNDMCSQTLAISYPYSTDFEGGNTEWTLDGEWAFSQNPNGNRSANSPVTFLDNNPNEIDQRYYRNYYTTLNQALTIPADAVVPTLGFGYKASLFSSDIYVQISTDGNSWSNLQRINDEYDHDTYAFREISLANYLGQSVQIRFRQYMHAANGARLFTIDDLSISDLSLPNLGYPYSNTFETSNEQSQFNDEGDWAISTSHDSYYPAQGSYFLDNNRQNIDQRYHRNQYVTLDGFITLPNDASNAVVAFDYRANLFTSDSVFLQIQEQGQTNWATIETFNEQENHADYTSFERELTRYAGKTVRFRFRQYHGPTNGLRTFSVDNFFVGEVPAPTYSYPYSNDFETAISTNAVNGRDHWALEGDWGISQTHDTDYVPYEGDYFLDNNSEFEDQRYHRNHYARLKGYIPIPADASAPVVSFWYEPNIFSGQVDLQIQVEGSNSWQHLFRFSEQLSHEGYVKHEVDLSNYLGSSVRFRFRQYWHSATGPRAFTLDNFYVGELNLPDYDYPYFNDFETSASTADINGQDQWSNGADWGFSTAHDTEYVPFSGLTFLDNNASFEDQRYHRNHYTQMLGYIPIPNDAIAPTLSFYYKANIFSGQTYLQIQEQGSNTWRTLQTFTDQLNHTTYARYEYALNSYIGKRVRFRFRQYWNSSNGERVFTVDDFKVDELVRDTYSYPYFNDFETAISTDAINGQDHWNHQGDWGISQSHDSEYYPRGGSYFLDNNADFEDQRYHRNHYVDMNGFVPIPADAEHPELSFWYRANIFSGQTYVQIQVLGTNTWTNLQTFQEQFTHSTYARYSYQLSQYRGKSVRVRFRQYWHGDSGGRVFTVDDFKIGENTQVAFGYPYENDFESPSGREEFIHEHDWGISQAHGDYTPYEGDWFIDSNPDVEDQRYHRNHYITSSGYISIPSNANLPTLSFWYRSNIFGGRLYTEIRRRNESTWRNVRFFQDEFNHDTYTRADINLDSYKGDEIFIRFRQYWHSDSGPRLFTIDNLRVGDFENIDYNYPYFNDFESATSTASVNGRDQWNDEGNWGVSNQNDVADSAFSQDWFLNANPKDEDQRYHRNHYITMLGFVSIPSAANNPKVSFYYDASVFSGFVDLQVQIQGQNSWRTLKRFDSDDNNQDYQEYIYLLNRYKGDTVRFRFRQYWHSTSGGRKFNVDNFFVGGDVLSQWYFEENYLDSSGQGYTLTPTNGPTFSNADRALDGPIASETSTCFYNEYDGTSYTRATNTETVTQLPEFTVSLWARAKQFGGLQALFTKGSGLGIYLNANGYVEWHYGDQVLISTTPLLVDEWQHLAFSFSSGQQRLYIGGAINASDSDVMTLSNVDEDIFLATEFDGNSVNTQRNFHGDLDEVRVYLTAQDTSAINTDMTTFHPCEIKAEPHHYLIEHSATGLTCEAENVTIKACMDDSCTELSDQVVTLDLLGNSEVKASTSFTGSTVVSFNHTTAEVLTLGLGNISLPATDTNTCLSGSDTSCRVTFSNAGFKFLYSGNEAIGPQVAGRDFNAPVQIQAVEDQNGVCQGVLNGNTQIQLAKQLTAPTTEGLALTAGSTVVPSLPSYSNNITLNFDSQSIATLPTLNYADAGQIRLSALYNQNGVTLTGDSSAFWVQPSTLRISASNASHSLNGIDANATNHHGAGEDFTLSVEALNDNNVVTGNYLPGNLQLSVKRVLPVVDGSVDGAFTYQGSNTLTSGSNHSFKDVNLGFVNGSYTSSNAKYSEVGVIELDIQDNDYGQDLSGNALLIEANERTLGRFRPAFYEQSVPLAGDGSMLNNYNSATVGMLCNMEQSFAYVGQRDQNNANQGSLRYSVLPRLKIEAKNQSGVTTQNYFGDFIKLPPNKVTIDAPVLDNTLAVVGSINADTITGYIKDSGNGVEQGSVIYTLSDSDHFYHERPNTPTEPFTSSFTLAINQIIDDDDVVATSTIDISPQGIEMRFGRFVVDNSFGPETSLIGQTMQVQYLRDGVYILNEQDSCTPVLTSNVSLSPNDTTVSGTSGAMLSGVYDSITLEATNAVTEIEVIYDAPLWLDFNWGNSVTFDQNPQGTATFGRFRSNDRVIHWRERN